MRLQLNCHLRLQPSDDLNRVEESSLNLLVLHCQVAPQLSPDQPLHSNVHGMAVGIYQSGGYKIEETNKWKPQCLW